MYEKVKGQELNNFAEMMRFIACDFAQMQDKFATLFRDNKRTEAYEFNSQIANTYQSYLEIVYKMGLLFNPLYLPPTFAMDTKIYDKLTQSLRRDGRNFMRWTFQQMLEYTQMTPVPTTQAEAINYFEHFFQEMARNEFSQDSTTGDTEMAVGRMKYLIDNELKPQGLAEKNGRYKVLSLGIGTAGTEQELLKVCPEMDLFGVDFVEPKKLREYGLPHNIPIAHADILNLNAEILQRGMTKIEDGQEVKVEIPDGKVDLVIAPWSVMAEFDLKEYRAVMTKLKAMAKFVITDMPLVAGPGSYLDKMDEGAGDFIIAADINGTIRKWRLYPPEAYLQACQEAGLFVGNVPPEGTTQGEIMRERWRQPQLNRTTNAQEYPEYPTGTNMRRINAWFSTQPLENNLAQAA